MYEIDFLAVGKAKPAEAIGLRFTHPTQPGRIVQVLVDGGWQADGDSVVAHLEHFYGGQLDLVVCTHPDGDHAGGLRAVLENIAVSELWIWDPSLHGAPSGEYENVDALLELAAARSIHAIEPFAGHSDFGGALLVAGPTRAYYEQCMREAHSALRKSIRAVKVTATSLLLRESSVSARERELGQMPPERPFGDAGGTEPINNSSIVLSLMVAGERFLLTADTGVPALNQALDVVDGSPHASAPLTLFKIPHHGSRHNLDLATIQRTLGDPDPFAPPRYSVVCLAPEADGTTYPSGRVANACTRRGYRVFERRDGWFTVQGDGAPGRPGTSPVYPLGPLQEDHDE